MWIYIEDFKILFRIWGSCSWYWFDKKVFIMLMLEKTLLTSNCLMIKLITLNYIMKNKPDTALTLELTNVIYNFKSSFEECRLQPNVNYIGFTTITLSRRLTMHLASGSIKCHFAGCHSRQLTRNYLTENTNIMRRDRGINRLQITEALLILASTPIINRQDTGSIRILKLFSWLFKYFQSH